MNDLGMGDDEPAPQDTGQNCAVWRAQLATLRLQREAAQNASKHDRSEKTMGQKASVISTDRSYEALHYRVNGDKPTAARDKQIEEDCKRRLAGFASMKGHAAIAVTPNSGCSWTSGQPTKQAAVAVVMNQCAKANVKTCSIAFAR